MRATARAKDRWVKKDSDLGVCFIARAEDEAGYKAFIKRNQNNQIEFWQNISTGFMVTEKTSIDRSLSRPSHHIFHKRGSADFKRGRERIDSQ